MTCLRHKTMHLQNVLIKLFMLGSHGCSICNEHYNWQIVTDRVTSLWCLGLGKRWCESMRRSLNDLLRFNVIRSRYIYFRWRDLSRSQCAFGYDKIRSGKIVQIKLPIGFRSDPNITTGVPDLGRLCTWRCICIHIGLPYVHQEPICSIAMGHDNDGDSFHDHDGRWGLRFNPSNISM